MYSNLSNKKIIHVCAWAQALWHFRLPLLKTHRATFGKTVIYCPARQYCENGKNFNESERHINKLIEEGFNVKIGSISSRLGINLIPQIRLLYNFLKKEQFDVLMAHQPMGGIVGITAGYLAGVPIRIYSTGGLKYVPQRDGFINKFYKHGEKALIRMTDAVFLVNQEDEEYLSSIPLLRDKACYVGPSGGCGINLSKFSTQRRFTYRATARKEIGLTNDNFVIGYSGRCVWEKGFRDIVDASELLINLIPERKILFLIIGDGIHLPQIREYIEKKGLPNSFKFLGYKYESDYYMSAFDLFILPSYREGLPIALLEAMAMGIPCIATNIRGNRELIRHKENGLLISQKNSKELAMAIACLIRNPGEAAAYGKMAKKSIHERFDENILVKRTMGIIHDLINKNGKI